ncbi:DUF2298 family protein [Natronomonas moolapensis 8.8.11]|uniref:DUF2298 family protein n=1 Tax=Natronomonas moolapensis (strain DSM 18674 / CECT 7526 / JCM 14361 / 8.8.11) TaxID=268739 RepID=M1XSD1_NATM8|nr:DUF2298 domain-containing protein [Natronomonas moolapensis]CCQ37232.1 DUF2298 family protein [Natronomonas moolapensis 8.8.11]
MEYLPVAAYLLFFAFVAATGAPIAAALFRELPKKGAAFAIPAALIPFAIVVFWVGQLSFGRHTVALALGAVAAGAAFAYRRGARPEWRAVAATYGVFVAGFLYVALLRAAAPGITPAGGEQFLHFGLVNALERAGSLPPPDVWYAGESLRYYYGTQLQVASVSMITGTELRYGFNLGIAAFYGVLVVVAYGLSGAIVERRGHSSRLGGVLGVAFVALGGPTTTPIRLLTPSLPEQIADPAGRAAFGFAAQRFYGGELGAAIADLSDPGSWTWWYTRYVVRGTIQEVPMYSFVKGDLHGHALSTGYVLFAAAVAYAYYRMPAEDRHRRITAVLGLGAIAGVFGFMNTWSLPTVGGLAVLAVGAADPHPATLLSGRLAAPIQAAGGDAGRRARVGSELGRLVAAGTVGTVVVVIGVAVASPFLVFGHVPSNEGIGFFPPRSPLGPFVVVYGGLLSMVAIYVATLGRPVLARIDRRYFALAGLCLPVAVATALRFDLGAVLVTASLVLVGWVLVRTDRGDFAVVLAIAGLGLLFALEVVHARLPRIDPPRWNTALKVAVQGWTLGAAGAGAAAAVVLSRASSRLAAYRGTDAASADAAGPSAAGAASPDRRVALRSSLAVVSVCLVLASTLVFPVMVAQQELGPEVASGGADLTLDGHEAIETSRPAQAEAIRWLEDRPGTPTIVEAPGPSYRFTSPASTFTGLPTVVGWDHQEEYRSPEAYERRVAHVDEIYTGEWAIAAERLERYDVRYVYVGPGERDRYGELRSFERPAFRVAFENEAVTIYRVDRDAL